MIGILGGMGHLATIDLMEKIVQLGASNTATEQENVPILVYSDPSVPDRRAALLSGGESPLPKLIQGVKRLENSGASLIVIACHTAHHWVDRLTSSIKIPIIHIADAACEEVRNTTPRGSKIAVLATEATIQSGFYQSRLSSIGLPPIHLASHEYFDFVEPSIALAKAGNSKLARPLMEQAMVALQKKGAQKVVLACSELPLLMRELQSCPLPYIDATRCLAQTAIDTYRQNQ
ncbi:aspartate/glutamate racemase family protein [Pseudomonas amygdali]|uniref:aspartate/glutamate racemase family protein n=1 Tax=Pseudomonas amygdali TaxID=47877 RepID=UPI001FB7B586|nr:amino acid racemase [Pseudomonas amygdali]UPT38521.1 amino acid racemase [Pseudomonas amygdali pv. loropetali]